MLTPLRDLARLLRTLEPRLHDRTYAFCSVPPEMDFSGLAPIVTVREPEGLTLVLPEAEARSAGLEPLFRAAWITLTVHSDLEAVGLTAAVATALAEAGIACNVVAGAYHDHLFVPVERGEEAMVVLRGLTSSSET